MRPLPSCLLLILVTELLFTLLTGCGADSEETQVLEAARQYARTASEVEVNLQVEAVEDDFARVRALPKNPEEADEALIYLKKERGKWQGLVIGNGFSPEDYQHLGIPEKIR